MNLNELYLRTIFCCMVCDGEIAESEIELVKTLTLQSDIFADVDVEVIINKYLDNVNVNGEKFILQYLKDIKNTDFTNEDAIKLIDLAIKTIEVDGCIEYSEVSFFKKIRSQLCISDEEILKALPDKEEYLLPDLIEPDFSSWNNLLDTKIEYINILEK